MDSINPLALEKISYGVFILTSKDGDEDFGCIVNTVCQVTFNPLRFSVTVNKKNKTHDAILKTKKLAASIFTKDVPFSIIEKFGFKSGQGKFTGVNDIKRTSAGLAYLNKHSNAVIEGEVLSTLDCGTHTIFVAELTQSILLNDSTSLTYSHYHEHIKPKANVSKKNGYVCKVCGYIYEGEPLPNGFICPICKRSSEVFEKL